jgi:hypothetical protein
VVHRLRHQELAHLPCVTSKRQRAELSAPSKNRKSKTES